MPFYVLAKITLYYIGERNRVSSAVTGIRMLYGIKLSHGIIICLPKDCLALGLLMTLLSLIVIVVYSGLNLFHHV